MNLVLFKHSDFWIIEKPAGFSCHNELPSLTQALEPLLKLDGHQIQSLHFINRLDKETSGIVVVALRANLVESLAQSLSQGHKTYQAVLRGPWKKTEIEFHWTWPISDKSEGRSNPQGLKSLQVPASTRGKVLASTPYLTRVSLNLETGRQHQIRKHSALSGQALVGDTRYNEKKYNEKMAAVYKTSRMALHAWQLRFTWKGQEHFFESPLPKEFSVWVPL